jgi:catechol 2,3-dioxygenase-like lactoylglutathione lyase family enzyme
MSVELNHTIVHAKDQQESAAFLAEILGLQDPEPFGHFLVVRADPAKKRIGEINRNDGGRGVYFHDPSGHFLEILTVPYGGGRR